MERLIHFWSLLPPALTVACGFPLGWFIAPLIDLLPITGGLIGICLIAVLRFPVRARWPVPAAWSSMLLQVLRYNALRYLLMGIVCWALFCDVVWIRIAGGLALAVLVLFKYSDLVWMISETERIVSRWGNGYFLTGSLALAGGIVFHDPILVLVGSGLHLLYWYACCLGFCGVLAFHFEGTARDDEDTLTSP